MGKTVCNYAGALALLSTALTFAAAPAAATITIFNTPGAVQPAENVLFQGLPPSGNNAFGVTNQTNTGVTFTGMEALLTPSMGQARVEAADSGLAQLSFALTDVTLGFAEVEFSIFRQRGTASMVDLTFTDQFGTDFTGTYSIGNGQNFFSARATDNQLITNVSFLLNGDAADVRQVRIGGIGNAGDPLDPGGLGNTVPEPASWAMLIVGFGLVGGAARRSQVRESRQSVA